MHNEALTAAGRSARSTSRVTPARALVPLAPDPQPDAQARTDRAEREPPTRDTRDDQEASRPGFGRIRTSAGFLTQLIACDRRLPAYRERRRAAPETASRAYAKAATPPSRPTHKIREF